MLANCLCTSIDSLPADTLQTVQSHCYKYNTSKLIWHLRKIWQSYPINRFNHDAAVTDNSNGVSRVQSSSPHLITVPHQSIWAALQLLLWGPLLITVAYKDTKCPLESLRAQFACKILAVNAILRGEFLEENRSWAADIIRGLHLTQQWATEHRWEQLNLNSENKHICNQSTIM